MMSPGRITAHTRVVRTEHLLSAEVGREVVMLNTATNAYYDTDSIGAAIWRALEVPVSVGDLVASLVEKYDVTPDVCEVDVMAFLEEALSEGLIRTVAGPAQS